MLLMNLWYINLVMSDLNWMLSSGLHLICLAYNVSIFLVNSSSEESLSIKLTAIFIKTFVCVVYIWLAYFLDYQKKLIFCNNHELLNVSFIHLIYYHSNMLRSGVHVLQACSWAYPINKI
jgi:hypothetical protein